MLKLVTGRLRPYVVEALSCILGLLVCEPPLLDQRLNSILRPGYGRRLAAIRVGLNVHRHHRTPAIWVSLFAACRRFWASLMRARPFAERGLPFGRQRSAQSLFMVSLALIAVRFCPSGLTPREKPLCK
jgi:hypothetical protein